MGRLKGYSLIEAVAALSLIAFILASSFYLFVSILNSSRNQEEFKSQARINYVSNLLRYSEAKDQVLARFNDSIYAKDDFQLRISKDPFDKSGRASSYKIFCIKENEVIGEETIILIDD